MSDQPVMNLAELLAQTARLYPQQPALIWQEQSWSWAELDQRVNAMVAALRALGIKKGDKILVHSRNNLPMFESCWVAFRLGCVWVPTNFRLAPSEVAYLASSSGAIAMICDSHFPQHAHAVRASSAQLNYLIWTGQDAAGDLSYETLIAQHAGATPETASVHYDDPLWFFYTSGTTGKPKAAILTHGQMAFVVTNHLADLIPGTTEKDCSIAVAPLSHGAGIHALLNVARGAATVLLPQEKLIAREFWQLVEKHRVSNLFTVPTIVKILVEDPAVDEFDHSSLRYVIYAGAPMYRADQKIALQKLGTVLVQYFGLGEVTGCITVLPADMHDEHDDSPNAHIGSCGRPRTGMEVAIFTDAKTRAKAGEIGEICCRGLAVFAGYHNDAAATTHALRDGWFHTGDLGYLDQRGLLYITGRESDMYISGGSNVYPREVEEVLLTHPAVAEVAVLGIPDAKWGEVGMAVVVLRHRIEVETLMAHLEGRCARYRWPAKIVFWDALPKSGYGKISKKEIKRLLLERGDIQND